MDSKLPFSEYWEQLPAEKLDVSLPLVCSELVQFLMAKIVSDGEVDIGRFGHGKKPGAVVALSVYNTDDMLNLRCLGSSNFELFVQVLDSDGDPHTAVCKLTDKQILLIPEGLRELMVRVAKTQKEFKWETNKLDN